MNQQPRKLIALGYALMALGLIATAASADVIPCITRPSEDVVLCFVRPGRVAQVLVKEGDQVEAGQVLMSLEDSIERIMVAQLKAMAEETVNIRAVEAQWQQKKVDAAKWEEVYNRGGATELERDHARLGALIAELSLEKARLEHEQAQRKYEEALVYLDRTELKSPITGRVEQVGVKVGEGADALQKVVRVVKIDPLWIDAPVPLEVARRLRLGMPAVVHLPDDAAPPAAQTGAHSPAAAVSRTTARRSAPVINADARIIHIAAVADPASNTLIVRVELPNPAGRQAGEMVAVSFPPVDNGAQDRAAVVPASAVSQDDQEGVNDEGGE
jgi:RND family efflux transporter MFP subunit